MSIIQTYAQRRKERELENALIRLRSALVLHRQHGNTASTLWHLVGELTACAKAALNVLGR